MKIKKHVIFLLLLGIAAIIATGTVSAADTYVNGSVSASGDGSSWETAYKTIQEGVNSATDGNTVYIASGTYTGEENKNIVINEIPKNIQIQGAGIDQTIIDLENSGSAFLNMRCGTDTSLNIKDLTIQNAKTDNRGGAIFNGGEMTVTNTKFISNAATEAGGAIYNIEGTLTISDCEFIINTANRGGAIWSDGTLIVTGSNFAGNAAIRNGVYIGDGGAIYIKGTATITDSIFEKNSANYHGGGGAIELYQGSLSVYNSKFIDNVANGPGGAIDTTYPQTALLISGSVFTGNSATIAGAVFSLGPLEISESIFDHNTADTLNGGAGAVIAGIGPNSIRYSTFSNNKAAYDGAISVGGTDVVPESGINILGCNFYNNQATVSGGAIGVGSGDGGNLPYLNIKYSRFVGNTAGTNPQDIYLHYQSAAAPTINIDAKLNWWGTNTGPEPGRIDADENRIPNSDSYTPWLILSTTGNPTSIYPGDSSLITVDLYMDSNGGNHQTDAAKYPATIPVQFTTNLGTLNNNGQTVDTILNSGTATVTLKSTVSGTAQTTAHVDNQQSSTTITIMTPQQGTTNINDAVQDLPATAFGKNADQQKITLNNMFNAVNNMITDGNYKGAIKKLEQIKSTLNTLKIDQTTKTELLNMINDLIDYLKTLI